jgi:DDE superfamily endonuclease
MGDIQKVSGEIPVEIWAQDECRLGLKPILRRVWTKCGERPEALSQIRYEWTYVYGFVRPATGETHWLILPNVSKECFEIALKRFAKWVGAGKNKRIILVLDGAGWHKSFSLNAPCGITLLFLPPYSPELQPAEKLWPLLREAVANRSFENIEAIEDTIEMRCRYLAENQSVIQGHTLFHWWNTNEETLLATV